MRGVIRIGDSNTHGGQVLTGSSKMIFDGRAVARKGDRVSCPLHGENEIVEGDELFTDQGLPVALDGHRCACGCTLISSLPQFARG